MPIRPAAPLPARAPAQPVPGPTPAEADRLHRQREREIDQALAQSFPASDPPSWTLGVTPSGVVATASVVRSPVPGAPATPSGKRH